MMPLFLDVRVSFRARDEVIEKLLSVRLTVVLLRVF